jgi:hypothetical protein
MTDAICFRLCLFEPFGDEIMRFLTIAAVLVASLVLWENPAVAWPGNSTRIGGVYRGPVQYARPLCFYQGKPVMSVAFCAMLHRHTARNRPWQNRPAH